MKDNLVNELGDLVNDCISRQAAIDAVDRLDIPEDMCVFEILSHIELEIGNLPSAQPERKKGEWLPDNRPDGGFWVCSECKFPSEAFAANVLYKFCPNCGADMRGEKDE